MAHVWMEHDKTHLRAELPDIPYWRANGWNPCDGPPPEPDLTRDAAPEPPETPGVLAVHEDAAVPAEPEPTSEEKE